MMRTVICAIIKNEERYVREWAEYHLGIGVSRIFLFEDYGSRSHVGLFEDEPRVTVSTLEAFGIKDHHNTRNQFTLYNKFLQKCKKDGEYDWVAFIDADEFVTFGDGDGYDLAGIEEEYKDIPALLMSWKNYGANGHIKRPDGGVLENYTKPSRVVESDMQWCKKSLVNIKMCNCMKNIHIAEGAIDVNGNHNEHSCLVYKKIWIRHFFTKSWEDFCERIFERGNMSNNFRTLDNFFKCNPDMAHMDEELIYSVRHRHCKNTMWLSKKYKLISGGNIKRQSR